MPARTRPHNHCIISYDTKYFLLIRSLGFNKNVSILILMQYFRVPLSRENLSSLLEFRKNSFSTKNYTIFETENWAETLSRRQLILAR